MQIENNHDFIDKHEAQGNRELKYYKDIYGNEVRLLTTKEKNFVNKGLIIASVFIVILVSGFMYKYYLLQKEIDERTKLYMTSGQSLTDGKEIINDGGVILSEDTEVVDIAEDGTIVAKTSGSTNVTIYKNIDENDFINKSDSKKKDDGEVSIYDVYNELGVEGEATIEVIVKQAVTGVNLNMSTVNLYIGETNKIVANVFPFTAYNKAVTWTSSDSSVATVDSNGVVTARSVGTAIITVTTSDGDFKDSTLVNVSKKESKNNIYLYADVDDFYVGDSNNIIAVVSPNESLLSDIVFSSSDNSVVSIDSNGKIVAKKAGKSTVTARIASENISTSIDLVVKEKVLEGISLSSDDLSLVIGDKVTLKTYFYPSDVNSSVTYTSNDNSVVSVNSKGEVMALKEGVTSIIVKSNNNVLAKCQVEVKNDIVKASNISINLEKNVISVGEKTKVSSSIKPNDATNKNVTYVSNDSSIAKVDSNGTVTGVSDGNAIITVTSSSGTSDSVSIKVENKDTSVEKITLPEGINVDAGRSVSVSAVISPSNTPKRKITWKSSDEKIAKVNSSGIITGVKSGEATITATIGEVSSSVNVNVLDVKVSKLTLNMSDVRLFVSEKINLKANVHPANATNENITWSSSDENIATVNKDGVVTALKEGSVVVKATSISNPNAFVECNVTVSKIDVESFKLSHKQILLTEGEKVNLKVSNIKPSSATYTNVAYSIEDTNIATVNKNGVISGVKSGKTTLTVTIDEVSKKIDVTVFKRGDKVYFIDTYSSSGPASDAILIESNGKYAMIDTGSQVASFGVIDFLHDLGVKRLEFILITHFHSESFGGVYGEIETDNLLLSDIRVGKLYMKPYSGSDSYFKDRDGKNLTSLSAITDRRKVRTSMFTTIREKAILNDVSYTPIDSSITSLSLGNFYFKLYNTADQLKLYSDKCLRNHNCSENSNSIVTYAKVNGKSLYLSGDIYNAYNDKKSKYLNNKTEVSVAKKVMNDFDNVDVYKASNYGNSDNNVEDALKLIKPTYSIITNSEFSFASSDSKGIERISKYTSKDLYYAGDGTVVLNVDTNGNMSFIQLND